MSRYTSTKPVFVGYTREKIIDSEGNDTGDVRTTAHVKSYGYTDVVMPKNRLLPTKAIHTQKEANERYKNVTLEDRMEDIADTLDCDVDMVDGIFCELIGDDTSMYNLKTFEHKLPLIMDSLLEMTVLKDRQVDDGDNE